MSATGLLRWGPGGLSPDDGEAPGTVEVADSWLVTEGRVLALAAHRARFLRSVAQASDIDASAFWNAAIAALPREGAWFPRVELRHDSVARSLWFRLRPAPKLTQSLTVVTHDGDDPRTVPGIKGPDLAALEEARARARLRGADEPVILASPGFVCDGASSAILWWRGDALCSPPVDFERVDSVTARSIITLALGLGITVRQDAVTPTELNGSEVWAVNALHGIRIVTKWIDGPPLACLPGRLRTWRARLDALRQPIEERTS